MEQPRPPVRRGPATALAEVELLARDAAVLDALSGDAWTGDVVLRDPWAPP